MSGGFYVVYQDDGFYTDFTEPTKGVRGTDWDEFPDMISAMRGGYARAAYVTTHTTGFKAVLDGKTRKYKTAEGVMTYKRKNPKAEVYRELDGKWVRLALPERVEDIFYEHQNDIQRFCGETAALRRQAKETTHEVPTPQPDGTAARKAPTHLP